MLVSHHLLLLRDSGPYVTLMMCCYTTVVIIWLSFAVNGFCAAYDTITTVVMLLLKRGL
jgi:hypothetical protein